jgi:DNA repair protein RecO (recombination protein O)
MSSGRRVELDALYVLHHRPWRDSSRMLEVITRDHGRLTLFARGVRGPRAAMASLLQPFRPLLGSWHGRGDTGQLVHAEPMPAVEGLPIGVPALALMSAYYLNELLLKLSVRADPQPQLFSLYSTTLSRMAEDSAALEAILRSFERRLLETLGYGLAFEMDARSGQAVRADAYYHFHPQLGFVETQAPGPDESVSSKVCLGRVLQAIDAEDWTRPGSLEHARRILRVALDHALEGRELRTRQVAKAVSRHQKIVDTSHDIRKVDALGCASGDK